MATATLIAIPVYQINSNNVISRALYPYGMNVYFGASTLVAQPISAANLQQLHGGTTALIYSYVKSSATGNTVFFSNLTTVAIAALANA